MVLNKQSALETASSLETASLDMQHHFKGYPLAVQKITLKHFILNCSMTSENTVLHIHSYSTVRYTS